MTEQWLPVVGYEGYYEVSSLGRVRRDGRVLIQNPDERGRLRVSLWRDGVGRTTPVHRIVARAFLGEPSDATHVVCHNNGDAGDNRATNLRWDTQGENILDIIRHGHNTRLNRTACLRGHEFTAETTSWRTDTKSGRKHRVCLICKRANEKRARLRRLGRLLDDGGVVRDQMVPDVEWKAEL